MFLKNKLLLGAMFLTLGCNGQEYDDYHNNYYSAEVAEAKSENTSDLIETIINIPIENPAEIPSEVQKYIQIGIEKDYQYANNPDEAGENTFSGTYIEAFGRGQCDEFALNALKELYSSNLKNLSYATFWERELKYGILITKQRGHAIIIYQNKSNYWKAISNGTDMGITADSLEGLMKEAISQYHYDIKKTTAYCIPKEEVPIEAIFSEDEVDYKNDLEQLQQRWQVALKD